MKPYRVRELNPVPPEQYSDAEKEAWLRGYNDGWITGEESLAVITPYDVDEQSSLYEAWDAGMDAAAAS